MKRLIQHRHAQISPHVSIWNYPQKETPRSVLLVDERYWLLYESLILVASQHAKIAEEIVLPRSTSIPLAGSFVRDYVDDTLWLRGSMLYKIGLRDSKPRA